MIKVGILGGGQLGRMLLQEAANYPIITYILENDADCPSAHLCHYFIKGDINNYEDVLAFGNLVDVLTIEIEAVSTDALETLEQKGKLIIPKVQCLKTIKNKLLQKKFYKTHEIPTADFVITQNSADLQQFLNFLPAVHKVGMGGYDGKGVQIIETEADLDKSFDAPSILEKKVDIAKEIAMIVAISQKRETVFYPPVEMIFDNYLNLLDYQICPANIEEPILWRLEAIAQKLAKAFDSPGIFAIEFMISKTGEVFVNETAPRVHNSGHHTIEASNTSQYDTLLRIMLNYPLGNTEISTPSALINLIGNQNYFEATRTEKVNQILELENTYLHDYGKKQFKTGRKMGHITLTAKNSNELLYKVKQIKQILNSSALQEI